MKYGPPVHKECCFCESPIEVLPLIEGSHTGSILWSDGFMDSPMMPKQEIIAKCGSCQEVVWLIDLPTVVIGEDNQELKDKITGYTPLTEDESFAILDTEHYQELPFELQIYLRVQAWHLGNKARRGKNDPADYSDEELANMQALSELLDLSDPHSRLMKAELYREQGKFEQAIEALDFLFDQQVEPIVNKIKQGAEQQLRYVLKVFG
jgi:hypothetical protein